MTTVAILGCGYVGLELGRRLLADTSVERVVGVRRSEAGAEAIEDAGIEAVQGDLTDERTLAALPDAEVLVFAASVGRSGSGTARELYVEGQAAVLDHFGTREESPDRHIYTSSTGVYGDHDGAWVDEETPLDPETEREHTLVDAETVALETAAEYGIDGTVTRFAGLYGPERYRLDRYLEGPVTAGVTNLTHRDDAAGAVAFLIREGHARSDVVLVVDDEPVSKWELADWLAEECHMPTPPKQTKAERLANSSVSDPARRRIEAEKRCDNEKLRSLGYELRFPTYREGYRRVIDEYNECMSE